MTYRRLYYYLLITGTLALAGVWWWSFRSWHTVSASSPPFTVSGRVASGTISLVWNPHEPTSFPPRVRTIPVRRIPETFSALMGKFNARAGNVYHLAFPVWLPWLIFVAGGYALLKFLERRSTGMKEKALAAARDTGNPA